METSINKKTSLDRKFDKLREREDTGKSRKGIQNRALSKMLSNKLAVIGVVVVSIVIVASIIAPLICKYDPQKVNLRMILKPPSSEHILGTDKVGRDVYARIIYGGRISILVGLGSAIGAALIGVCIGAYTGYRGGWIDRLILRITEIVMAFPQIILVLLLVAILGQSLMNLMVIFTLTGWGGLF